MGNKLFDQFSLLHFSSGVIAYFFGIDFFLWLILNIAFEVLENTEYGMQAIRSYIKFWPGGKISPDTYLNSISDIAFCMLGWYVAYSLDRWYKRKSKRTMIY